MSKTLYPLYKCILKRDNRGFHDLFDPFEEKDEVDEHMRHLFYFHYLTEHGETQTWKHAKHVWTNSAKRVDMDCAPVKR
jgi:hypothetical protein